MMFSQLCRARRRTLWNKLAVRSPQLAGGGSCALHPSAPSSVFVESQRCQDLDSNDDEGRCHLIHCTFCDFRVCCRENQQIPASALESEQEHCQRAEIKDTQNPAYGLYTKNWLEINFNEPNKESTESITYETLCKEGDNSFKFPELKISSDINSASQKQQVTVKVKKTPHNHLSCENEKKSGNSFEVTNHVPNEQKKVQTWPAYKYKEIYGEEALAIRNCDNNSNACVIEHSFDSGKPQKLTKQGTTISLSVKVKLPTATKDRTPTLSLKRHITKTDDRKMDPQATSQHASRNDIHRQKPVQKNSRSKLQSTSATGESRNPKRSTSDNVRMDPLAEIARIKTEESIQEWLARIGESANNSAWADESHNQNESLSLEWRKSLVPETDEDTDKGAKINSGSTDSHGYQGNSTKQAEVRSSSEERLESCNELDEDLNSQTIDLNDLLYNASKASPANIPMVIMQCSRLHPHIGSKPPFQQNTLPMGTLVTALYQESDWLYVQTPHGVEGFVISSNCVPIGTVNDSSPTSRRPWEPCDFPIQTNTNKKCDFLRQQGSYISTTLPTNIGKHQAAPYVSTVKMKTNFYSDRYFSHTFKTKDLIKTAKTVTDILRSSPETKITNQ